MNVPSRFLTGAVILVLAFGAFAQTPGPDEEEPKVLERISITGYHIKRIDFEGPAPVLVFRREDFEKSGVNTLGEFARYLTINFPEPVRQQGAIGATGFDLRGIGLDTTLVLVNGYRVAPYAQLAENAVDINAIPVSAIERVEILKDGASAIYGADAIAGVVNIILRDSFEGVELNAGYGTSEHGDGQELMADLVTGRDNGRGSLLFSLSWYQRQPQAMRDRDWSSDVDFSPIGGPNRRSPLGSPPGFAGYDTWIVTHDPECGTDPNISSVGPSYWGAEWGTTCQYNYAASSDLLWGIDRVGASLNGRYELKAGLSAFADLLYSHVEGEVDRAPAPFGESGIYGSDWGFPYVTADHPGNPFGEDGEVLYRPLSLGNRTHRNDSTAYRLVAGLEGSRNGWDWKLSGLYSRNKVDKTLQNMASYSRFQHALLGMGGPSGDLLYNPFGYEPQNDPALLDWIRAEGELKDRTDERSVDLLVSRFFGHLPGGPVVLAIGAQYREQKLEQWANDALLSGDLGTTHEPIAAKRDIFSAYFEFSLPLLDSLEAQLALRYEHYSDFGSTTNPKVALRWQPLTSLMFRGSYSTSFKPPSFYELYMPVLPEYRQFFDYERCDYTGQPRDCDNLYWAPVESGGNPDLEPEKGKSWFAGVVWTPGAVPGLEFQLDFWKFKHKQRIEFISGEWVLWQRGDFGITREPTEPDGTPGRITRVEESFLNTDELLTNGFDTTIRYRWQTDRAGDFRISLMHTYVDKWQITDSVDLDIVGLNYAGKYGWSGALPRNRANLNLSWEMGPHGAAANVHYIGHYQNWMNLYEDGQRTDRPMDISSHTTMDLQYSYQFEKLRDAVFRIGCNNVADKDPPLTYSTFNQPFHDPRGRFWYVRWKQPIR